MFLSGTNTSSERGKCKCLQIWAQPSAGSTLLSFQSGKVTKLFHLVPFFPTSLHLSWLYKTLCTYFLLPAVSQLLGFPICSVLLAVLLPCTVSCHLLFPCPCTEGCSHKIEVVSLPKVFLETCFFQTPSRYLKRWASLPLFHYLSEKNIYMCVCVERSFDILFSHALAFCWVSC